MAVKIHVIGSGAVSSVLVTAPTEAEAHAAVAEFAGACPGAAFGPVVERGGDVFGAAGEAPSAAVDTARFLLDFD